jgi:formylmethanofuran dehydrogenase subunit E
MDEILKQIEKFHGHLGPYVVLGYKMGEIANRILGKDFFSKKATVFSGISPPLSCIIDGVQISSGCTLGKGNIIVNNDGLAKTQFSDNNGKKIEITLKSNIKNEIDTIVTEENIIDYSEKLFKKPDNELFYIVR